MYKRGFTTYLIFVLCFTSCSWREYFVVQNRSQLPCRISYRLDTSMRGIPLFTLRPSLYPISRAGEIQWGKEMSFADEDTNLNVISILLPPNSALILGELSNDHYEKYSQQFNNDRIFNLRSISIGTLTIDATAFDRHFKKKGGVIRYVIK